MILKSIYLFELNVEYFINLSWDESQWNVTGNVESGSVNVELELCARQKTMIIRLDYAIFCILAQDLIELNLTLMNLNGPDVWTHVQSIIEPWSQLSLTRRNLRD